MKENSNNSYPLINKEECVGCGKCVSECPYVVLYQEAKKTTPIINHNRICITCGHCVAICPKEAISHPNMDANQFIPSETEFDLNTIEMFLKSKRSIRDFSDKKVENELIEQFINVSCQAPTDGNSEERGYVVINDRAKVLNIESSIIEVFKKFIKASEQSEIPENTKELLRSRAIVEFYESGGHPVFKSNSCLIFIYGPEINPFSWYNCALASDYLMLKAHSLRIGSCIIGMALYDVKSMGMLLNIPKGQQIYSAITLGYPSVKYKKTVSRKKPNIIWK